jgi:hypothetical protein
MPTAAAERVSFTGFLSLLKSLPLFSPSGNIHPLERPLLLMPTPSTLSLCPPGLPAAALAALENKLAEYGKVLLSMRNRIVALQVGCWALKPPGGHHHLTT